MAEPKTAKLIAEIDAASTNQQLRKRAELAEKRLADMVESFERYRAARFILPKAGRPNIKGTFYRASFGDTHGSHVDKPAFAAAISDIELLQPREVVIGGDTLDCGGFLAKHHTEHYVADVERTFEEDCVCANGQLDEVRKRAPDAEIIQLEGNHEQRIERWIVTQTLRNAKDAEFLRRVWGPETLLGIEKRGIRYFRRNECHMGLKERGVIKLGKCHFTHGITTAKHSASVTVDKFAANVVYFHTHRADSSVVTKVQTGTIGAWCPGCLCELNPLYRHSSPTDWTHGYAVQLVTPEGDFLHINVPIIDGRSLLMQFISEVKL